MIYLLCDRDKCQLVDTPFTKLFTDQAAQKRVIFSTKELEERKTYIYIQHFLKNDKYYRLSIELQTIDGTLHFIYDKRFIFTIKTLSTFLKDHYYDTQCNDSEIESVNNDEHTTLREFQDIGKLIN